MDARPVMTGEREPEKIDWSAIGRSIGVREAKPSDSAEILNQLFNRRGGPLVLLDDSRKTIALERSIEQHKGWLTKEHPEVKLLGLYPVLKDWGRVNRPGWNPLLVTPVEKCPVWNGLDKFPIPKDQRKRLERVRKRIQFDDVWVAHEVPPHIADRAMAGQIDKDWFLPAPPVTRGETFGKITQKMLKFGLTVLTLGLVAVPALGAATLVATALPLTTALALDPIIYAAKIQGNIAYVVELCRFDYQVSPRGN